MGTTSLQIIAWSTVVAMVGDPAHPDRIPERPPDELVFDHSITDQQLVADIQQQFDSRPRGRWPPRGRSFGGTVMSLTSYHYEFRFAMDGVTTQVYAGLLNSMTWSVTTRGEQLETEAVAGPQGCVLYGASLLIELHRRIEMPLPDWWLATKVAPGADSG